MDFHHENGHELAEEVFELFLRFSRQRCQARRLHVRNTVVLPTDGLILRHSTRRCLHHPAQRGRNPSLSEAQQIQSQECARGRRRLGRHLATADRFRRFVPTTLLDERLARLLPIDDDSAARYPGPGLLSHQLTRHGELYIVLRQLLWNCTQFIGHLAHLQPRLAYDLSGNGRCGNRGSLADKLLRTGCRLGKRLVVAVVGITLKGVLEI